MSTICSTWVKRRLLIPHQNRGISTYEAYDNISLHVFQHMGVGPLDFINALGWIGGVHSLFSLFGGRETEIGKSSEWNLLLPAQVFFKAISDNFRAFKLLVGLNDYQVVEDILCFSHMVQITHAHAP